MNEAVAVPAERAGMLCCHPGQESFSVNDNFAQNPKKQNGARAGFTLRFAGILT